MEPDSPDMVRFKSATTSDVANTQVKSFTGIFVHIPPEHFMKNVEYCLFLLQIKAVLVYISLDEHFQASRLLRYCLNEKNDIQKSLSQKLSLNPCWSFSPGGYPGFEGKRKFREIDDPLFACVRAQVGNLQRF